MSRRTTRPARPGRAWKVGELAERTGLTVRTLHHYDELGLLRPRERSDSAHGSGHRLYTAEDLARLQQIVSLKQLGFSLEQIGQYLSRPDFDPRQVVRLQLERVRRQAAELRQLEHRLAALASALDQGETVSPDEFLDTIREMSMFEKYYTPEQLEQLRIRGEAIGPERMRSVEKDWADLRSDVQAALDAGVDPSDPRAQELARRWYGLIEEFTGGDPGIFRSLQNLYQNETNVHGMDVAAMRPTLAFIKQAAASAGITTPGA